MGSVNKVIVVGNLGKDPEVRQTGGGRAVCNFSVACSERFKDRDGNQQEKTEWVRIVAWGPLADNCGKYLARGRQVYVEGSLQTRSWEKDGVTHYQTEVVARDVVFLGPKDGGSGQQAPTQRQDRRQQQEQDPFAEGVSDDDIPF